MASSLPDIYACGSAVNIIQALSNERIWMPEPAIISRSANIAGFNAACDNPHDYEKVKPFCGTLVIQIGNNSFARTGLQDHQARMLFGDDNVLTTTVFKHSTCVKLLVNKAHNIIIGGEVFGKNGILRRIDLIAIAVREGWSCEHLIDVDMAYKSKDILSFEPLKEAATRALLAVRDRSHLVSIEQLALWLAHKKNFHLVDVGKKPALAANVQSLHMPLEHLRDRLDELPCDDPIVLYSHSGHRSYLAHMALKQRGLNNVYYLDGGIVSWKLMDF
jgi:rhodanese-related sulfurtransferase